MPAETEYVTINNQLRLVLFGLECAIDVEFAPDVVEQIFIDTRSDSRSEKHYALWSGARLKVKGYVEDYEPEALWLTVEADRPFRPSLAALVEKAKYQAYRLERWQESETPAT